MVLPRRTACKTIGYMECQVSLEVLSVGSEALAAASEAPFVAFSPCLVTIIVPYAPAVPLLLMSFNSNETSGAQGALA